MTSNVDKLTAVLTHWLRPMGDSVVNLIIGDKLNGINAWAKSVFPLPSNYTIMNDLGFLLNPSFEMMVSPAIRRVLDGSGVDEEHMPAYAHRLADAMYDECMKKGSITIFGDIILRGDDIICLQDLLDKNLPDEGYEEYQVIH